jgi:hypothetical protein
VALESKGKGGYIVNVATSIYGRQKSKKGKPNNQWFINQINQGNLRYINNKKSRAWAGSAGLSLPAGGTPASATVNTIYTEADLVKLREANPTLYQRVFNGSPSRHKYFDLRYVGTGEGARVYGWGLYFSSLREVGEYYRKKLAQDTDVFLYDGERVVKTNEGWLFEEDGGIEDHDSPVHLALDVYAYYMNMIDARAHLRKRIDELENSRKEAEITGEILDDAEMESEISKVKEALEELENIKLAEPGQVYEAEIPENDELLNWDKTFEEQPEKVKEALKALFADYFGDRYNGVPNFTGEELYRKI